MQLDAVLHQRILVHDPEDEVPEDLVGQRASADERDGPLGVARSEQPVDDRQRVERVDAGQLKVGFLNRERKCRIRKSWGVGTP